MDIGVREKSGFHIVDIAGKIDRLKDSMDLKERLCSIIDGGVSRLALNLADVTYLDSGALNVLIYCHNILKRNDGTFLLISPNEYVLDVLNIVGIDRFITIYSTEGEFENEVQKS